MSRIVAVLDACVLYPAPLRDFLIRLAMHGLYQARWTSEIHEEWVSNLLLKRPDLNRAQLQRTCELMHLALPHSRVQDYESHIEGIQLPDPSDRHVAAAAIQSQATTIVTFNLKDFPPSVLATYEIEATHPDAFVASLLLAKKELALQAARDHRLSLKRPPKSAQQYLATLADQGLKVTAELMRSHADCI